jgi:MFS family permease
MAAVLDTVGINSDVGKANVNLGYNVEQFCFAIIGAQFVERIGRRKMMLAGFFGCCVIWVCMTASAGTLAQSLVSGSVKDSTAKFSNHSASNAVLFFIFAFGAWYSFNITPLQALYPVEVYSYEMRAKGMAVQSFAVNAAGMMNTYAWPEALKQIAWKTYIVFVAWTFVQVCLVAATLNPGVCGF